MSNQNEKVNECLQYVSNVVNEALSQHHQLTESISKADLQKYLSIIKNTPPFQNCTIICDETNNSEENINNDVLKVDIIAPANMLFPDGIHAGEIREQGFDLPNDIPDCAVLKGDYFEWVKLNFMVDSGDNIEFLEK